LYHHATQERRFLPGLKARGFCAGEAMSVPAPTQAATASQEVPARIGRFVIIREVGRGSAGVVYLAHDPDHSRDVAIKVYNTDSTDAQPSEEQASLERRMFLSEAQLVGVLQHPYILPIHDAGEEHGRCYVVTEHVHDARNLSAYCRPGSLLPVSTVVEVIFKCAKALHYAHASGVIHRDIKPSNILLTPQGDVRIIDFGIALVADSEGAHVSRVEGIAGSPSYMSPEQVQSLPLSNRSDLYSLGAVMYELLAGRRPFRADSLEKLMHQIIYATPPPIHSLRQEVPEEIENVVAVALQKDPARRYNSGLDFAAELTRLHQLLRDESGRSERQEHFAVLRTLSFFHEFSHTEIWEVLRASVWQSYSAGEEIITEGELDDRFYVLIGGQCTVERYGRRIATLQRGDCFGEAAYVPGARRSATIRALDQTVALKVSSALLEQVSANCQLRFNRVFLRTLIGRLHRAESGVH
jgi:serine/threonine protein kinase